MNVGQQILRSAATIPFAIATSTARIEGVPQGSYIKPTIPIERVPTIREPQNGGTQVLKPRGVISPSELGDGALAGPSVHPRMAHLERTMLDYSMLEDGWAGDGSLAPSENALLAMKTVVERLPRGLPIPTPSVTFNGEPGLFWDEDSYFMDVAFDGERAFSGFVRSKASTQDQFQEGILIDGDWQDILIAMSKRFEA